MFRVRKKIKISKIMIKNELQYNVPLTMEQI